ncbi:MAG TPA: hypothetical protein VE782_15840 [Myxococcaceae bacterium]|nr:hypothetical protein [Myxococcaceae bacterium]
MTPDAVPWEWLAPDVQLYETRLRVLEDKLVRAEAIHVALSRMQNQLAERLKAGLGPCADATGESLVARTRVLGPALRDAAQAARAELARVRALRESPTVAPLLGGPEQSRLDALTERVKSASRRYLVALEWNRRFIPDESRCAARVQASPGLPAPDGAPNRGPVAVIGAGGGHICPGQLRAEGVIVLDRPEACYALQDCACSPKPVFPGAVIAP